MKADRHELKRINFSPKGQDVPEFSDCRCPKRQVLGEEKENFAEITGCCFIASGRRGLGEPTEASDK